MFTWRPRSGSNRHLHLNYNRLVSTVIKYLPVKVFIKYSKSNLLRSARPSRLGLSLVSSCGGIDENKYNYNIVQYKITGPIKNS